MDTEEKIKESLQKWEERVLNPWLAKRPERKKAFTTPSGIEVRRLYTPLDLIYIFHYDTDMVDILCLHG